MAKSPTRIIDQIRQQLLTNILVGPKPPLDEMALLSQEYQDAWQAKGEVPADAILATVLDGPGQWFAKPRTPAEHAFDQEAEQLLRKKRWAESEQLTSLAKVEKLLANNERWRQSVLEHDRKLNRKLEQCRVDSEQATTSAQAATVQRRFRQCQKVRQANLSEPAITRAAPASSRPSPTFPKDHSRIPFRRHPEYPFRPGLSTCSQQTSKYSGVRHLRRLRPADNRSKRVGPTRARSRPAAETSRPSAGGG